MDSLASLVEWIETGVKAGGQALIEHAPTVAQQYVAYTKTVSAVSVAGMLLLLATSVAAFCVAAFRKTWVIDNPGHYNHGDWPEMRAMFAIFSPMAALFSLFLLSCSSAVPTLIKAHTAPMVLVLEKVSSLL